MLSVFITPWTKPTSIHWATSDACAATTASNSARYGLLGVRRRRGGGGRWRGRPAAAAGRRRRSPRRTGTCRRAGGSGDPREHGAGQDGLASTGAPVADDGEGPGRGDAERVHRLADHVLAQHRADGRQPVAAAGERRAPGALEVEVAQPAARSTSSPSSSARPSPSRGRVAAELVAGVGLRHRRRTLGEPRAGEQPEAVGAPEPVGVDAELGGQCLVEGQQSRRGTSSADHATASSGSSSAKRPWKTDGEDSVRITLQRYVENLRPGRRRTFRIWTSRPRNETDMSAALGRAEGHGGRRTSEEPA